MICKPADPVTAEELADLEAAVGAMYDHTLNIYREGPLATDAYGGREDDVPTLRYTNIPCEIQPGAAHVVDVADVGQLVDTQLYTITVGLSTDVLKGDLVEITSFHNLKLKVNVVYEPESYAMEKRFSADKE